MKILFYFLILFFPLFCFSQNESIDENLLLKTDKENILFNQVIEQFIYNEKEELIKTELIVSYDYIDKLYLENNVFFNENDIYSNTIKNGNEYTFFVGDHFYKDENQNIFTIEHGATTTLEAFNLQTKLSFLEKIKNIFFKKAIADIYYSGAGDGAIYKNNSNNWDTTHNATTGAYNEYTSSNFYGGSTGYNASSNYFIARTFLPFDTSNIVDNSTISNVHLFVKPSSITNDDNDGSDYIAVVQTSQANTSILANDDYDQCGTIHSPNIGSDLKDYGTFVVGTYIDFTLNATGTNWISKTGISQLGLREGHDLIDSSFSGSAGTFNRIEMYFSEQTGTTSDPYLSLTATPISQQEDDCPPCYCNVYSGVSRFIKYLPILLTAFILYAIIFILMLKPKNI